MAEYKVSEKSSRESEKHKQFAKECALEGLATQAFYFIDKARKDIEKEEHTEQSLNASKNYLRRLENLAKSHGVKTALSYAADAAQYRDEERMEYFIEQAVGWASKFRMDISDKIKGVRNLYTPKSTNL